MQNKVQKNKLITIIILSSFIINQSLIIAQINYNVQKPTIHETTENHKQFKRVTDYSKNRKTTSILNPDWARWEEWLKIKNEPQSKSSRSGNWENFGPHNVSGRIISIAFHPTDSNTIYAGSAGGGLWKTTNNGLTWNPLTDFLPSLAIGAIAINPKNPNKILIATGEGYSLLTEFSSGIGILVSYDAGQTFSTTSFTAPLNQNFAGMDIAWSPKDTNKVCVATSFGVYFSPDGGISYTGTLNRLPSRMVMDPQHPDTLYLSARYYNASIPGGFYRSFNMGQTWSPIGTGLPNGNDFGYASISVNANYPNKLLLNISSSDFNGVGPMHGLYKSSNYGVSWTQIPTNVDIHCYPAPGNNICQGWFANTICYSKNDTNTIFAGGTRFWKSEDAGLTWLLKDTTLSSAYALHVDHHQTLYHPLTGVLFDANDGGINYTNDDGTTWTSISNGLITHQFYTLSSAETDPEMVIGGTQDVGFFSNHQAHSTPIWNNRFNGDAFGNVIDYTDKNKWYATIFGQYKRVKSVNGGTNWSLLNNGTSADDQWRMPMVIHPSNPNILLSSNNNFMYKTIDGGLNWQTTSTFGYINCFEFDKISPNEVYASKLHTGIVYKSFDAGSTWAILANSPGAPITDIATDPNQTGIVYATVGSFASQDQVFKSIDGGLNWTNISNNFPLIPANTICINPYNSDIIYVGADLGVWESIDAGNTWLLYNNLTLPYVVIGDMHYYKPDSTLRVGTYGRGYWKIKTYPTNSSTSENYESTIISQKLNPNPAKKGTVFYTVINSKKPYNTTIKIHNSMGSLIFTQKIELINGESEIPLLAPKVAGIYFITIQIGNENKYSKLVVSD